MSEICEFLHESGLFDYIPGTLYDENYTNQMNVLNQFVTYHLLPQRIGREKLVIHYNELGYNVSSSKSPSIPIMDYYQTIIREAERYDFFDFGETVTGYQYAIVYLDEDTVPTLLLAEMTWDDIRYLKLFHYDPEQHLLEAFGLLIQNILQPILRIMIPRMMVRTTGRTTLIDTRPTQSAPAIAVRVPADISCIQPV